MLHHGKTHLAELWWDHRATLSQSVRIRQKLWKKGVGKLPDSTTARQPHLQLLWVLCQWKILNCDFKDPSKKKKKKNSCFLPSRAQAAQDGKGAAMMVPPALTWDALLVSTTLSYDPEYILTCKNPTERSWAIAATHRCPLDWVTAPSTCKHCTVTLFWSQCYHSARGHLIWLPLAGATSTAWNAFVLRQASHFRAIPPLTASSTFPVRTPPRHL